MSLLDSLLDLILPAKCILCERPPSVLCADCVIRFDNRVRRVSRNSVAGIALCEFDSEVSAVISAFKEHGQFAIVNLLVDRLLTETQIREIQGFQAEVLVPLPSSAKGFAKRGFSPADVVAKRLARALQLPVYSKALRLVRVAADQASLDLQARHTNLAGAMAASAAIAGKRVLLVDDIVTTGSSVAEAARAVELADGQVVGFFAFAETVLRMSAQIEK